MFNRILTKLLLMLLAGCNCTLGQSVVACCCECYNEPASCMKGGWFLDHMTVSCFRHLTLGWTTYSFLTLLQLDPLVVLGPPKCGRRVTILGDTSDSFKMVDLAQWVPSKLYVMWSVTIPFFQEVSIIVSIVCFQLPVFPYILTLGLRSKKTSYFYRTGYILYPYF
jgi:hypothetical protein